jgi:hypothetical protein
MAMSTTHDDQVRVTGGSSGPSRPVKTALLMFALVGGFFLLREHWDHVVGNWVYLLLLACPVMHLFHGHGGHGHHDHHDAGTVRSPNPDA